MSLSTLDPVAPKSNSTAKKADKNVPAKDWVKIASQLSAEFRKTATIREKQRTKVTAEIELLKEAGLINLLIPKKFGGEGGTFADTVNVVTEIARGDGSIGALLAFHYYTYSVPRFFDFKGEGEKFLRESAKNNWFWGNITQPKEKDFRIDALPDGRFLLNGKKKWATGASLGDVTTVVGPRTDRKELLYALLPTDRKGLKFHDDWDHLGLRLADTVTVSFDNVEAGPDDVIPSTLGAPQLSFAPFYVPFANVLYGAIFLGSTLGAIDSALDYTRHKAKPFFGGPIPPAQDPYNLIEYGKARIKVQAVRALLNEAIHDVQVAWDNRHDLTRELLSDLAVRGGSARAYAAEIGLEITSKIYDVTGGVSATSNEYQFDRHWRDIRILSVHDPLVYAIRGIGDNLVNGTLVELPPFV